MPKRRPSHDRRPARARLTRATGSSSGPRLAGPVLVGVVVVATLAVLLGSVAGSGESSASGSPRASVASAATPPTPTSAAAGEASQTAPSPTPGATGAPAISSISCDVDEQVTYHVHAHLNIRFEGELQPVPTDVGVLETCLYWLHTHASQGVVHVEAPTEAAYTLGQFFDVWGQALSGTQVLGRTVGAGETLSVFVDREPYTGDPRSIVLGDLKAIELQIGTEPFDPLPYTFPAEFT